MTYVFAFMLGLFLGVAWGYFTVRRMRAAMHDLGYRGVRL